ncbi:MAG TPA: RNA methyltransferase [Cyclobacteriaceae bacterium]|nr:RNA methyltransferase [Cyclobacteriaceae bacterium]
MKKVKLEELGRISVDEFKVVPKIPLCILLDNVRSLHNVGSAFRTADAFRVEKIFLCGITGKPPHREIQKTALGATESVDWEYAESAVNTIQQLKLNGYTIIVIEQTTESISLDTHNPTRAEKICLVFGNEVEGISEEVIALADKAIEIPQGGTKHSLNVAVCMGIVLWEFFQKLKDKA